jgi:hypothetical protein
MVIITPPCYRSECIPEDMPLGMTSGRLLNIAGVGFVSFFVERLANRL